MKGMLSFIRELSRYRSAMFGGVIIIGLIVLALYTVITIPYDYAMQLWRGGEEVWGDNPRNGLPEWANLFMGNNLAPTIVLNSQTNSTVIKKAQDVSADMRTADLSMPFEYNSNGFPTEVNIFFTAKYDKKKPQATVLWKTPDGREIQLADMTVGSNDRFAISIDQKLTRKFNDVNPEIALFAKPGTAGKNSTPEVLRGKYELVIQGLTFEKDSTLDAKLVAYGQVAGVAGTDHKRRDIMLALLWGTPVALAFGFLAAVGTTLVTFSIAAVGSWFGGWVDALIQRLTEINSVLPFLPILILIGTFYSRNIWTVLGVVILLGIFSLSIKTYRSMFLQVKEMPYIEAARTYGASNFRIVFQYMMPKIAPVLIPSFVTQIPSFVFLEASLAVLGLGDPLLPTWGKLLNDAYTNGALYKGYYYWVIEPALLLMLTGLGFATVGFALDRIFNPRLREML
ncbi:MAG: ABC transporter permease [Chloroflexi bacterium]|nr:ABC transporter permease [Chloroflexota bacterium]